MDNNDFLKKIKEAFDKFLVTNSNSNEKLKILHGAIASDLQNKLGDNYTVHSLGFNDGREVNVMGKYTKKRIDITIKKNNNPIAFIGLKFIMQNYEQNSNNYFENMLGETANIRRTGKPYFQILILPSCVPYYKDGGILTKKERINNNRLEKYILLSKEDNKYLYVPNGFLFYFVDLPELPDNIASRDSYRDYFLKLGDFKIKANKNIYEFGDLFIYNNYEKFINKVCQAIKNI